MAFLETIPSNWNQPALALYIVLDEFGAEVIQDVHRILKHSGLSRNLIDSTLSIQPDLEDGELQIFSGQDRHWSSMQTSADEFDEARQQSRHLIKENLGFIQQAIEKELHDLRTHKNLIKAGFSEGLPPNLYVFLLADIKQPISAGAVIPLLRQLHTRLSDDPYATLLPFINMAHFPAEIPAEHAAVLAKATEAQWCDTEQQIADTLRSLDSLLGSPDRINPPIFKQNQNLVFLFDRFKEGAFEVQNPDELRILVSNTVFGFLTGHIPQFLQERLPSQEQIEYSAPYHSAGSTLLYYSHECLIEYCALRLAECLLEKHLEGKQGEQSDHLGDSMADDESDAQNIAAIVEPYLDIQGNWKSWITNISQDFHFDYRTESISMQLDKPSFDSLSRDQWAAHVNTWSETCLNESWPQILSKLTENIQAHRQHWLEEYQNFFHALPNQLLAVDLPLYVTHWTIQSVETKLKEEHSLLANWTCVEPLPLEGHLEALKQMAQCPMQHKGVRKMLAAAKTTWQDLRQFIRYQASPESGHLPQERRVEMERIWESSPSKILFLERWFLEVLHWDEQQLLKKREQCIQIIENNLCSMVQQHLKSEFSASSKPQFEKIFETYEDFDRFSKQYYEAFTLVQQHLRNSTPWRSAHEPFRVNAVDKAVAQWAYQAYQAPLEQINLKLSQQDQFLANWEQVQAEDIYLQLIDFAKEQFAPLAALSLTDLSPHRSDTPEDYLPLLYQAALPLLRPDFDKTGGRAGYETRLILSGDDNLKAFRQVFHSGNTEWDERNLPNQHLLSFCRLRSLIPLKAIEDRFERSDRSDPDQQDQLSASKSNGRWRTVG